MAKILGVEIGASLIRVTEVDYKAKNPKVYKKFTIPTPEGAVRDDVLVISDTLVNTVKEAFNAHHVHTKQMVFALNSTKIANREVSIPFVKENRVADIIKSNAADFFPVDLEQYELGHTIVGTVENENSAKQLKVLIYAVPKTIIGSYFDFAAALGCSVSAFDYSGNSIYQMVRKQCDTGVKMIVKVDEKASILTILKDSIVVLQRTIAYGVDEAISTVMNSSFSQNSSYEEALKLLCEKPCIQPTAEEGDSDFLDLEDASGVSEVMREEVASSLNYLASGIFRVVDYYNSRNTEAPIEKAYITGLGGDFCGIAEFFSQAIDVPMVPIKELEGFRLDRDFKDEPAGRYLTCVGAAIAPLGFLGEQADKKSIEVAPDAKGMRNVSILVFVGGILIAVALAAASMITLQTAKSEKEALEKRAEELRPVKEIYVAYLQQKYTYDKLAYLYDYTTSPNDSMIHFIEEMERKMPASLNVQSFNSTKETLSMSLTVKDKREASKLIQLFREFDSISGVSVNGISDSGAVMEGEQTEEEGQVTFSITLTYKTMQEMKAQEQLAAEEAVAAAEASEEITEQE